MRILIDGQPGESYWLAFDKASSRNEAARRFAQRGWYVNTWQDVAGPSLHAARRWFGGIGR